MLVVTGASSGLGRAIARLAGERGAKVVVTARNAEALDSVGEIERAGSEALAVPGDVTDRGHVERAVAAAVERFGRVDTYVANAIVTVYAEAERLDEAELRRVWEVNFFGVVYGYWAALPHLRESKGTFLHVSSALAYRGIPLQAAYCSTKAGTSVAISLVLPGAINTAAVRPRPPEDRLPAAAGAPDLPARALRRGGAALRRASPARAAGLVGAQKLLWGQKLSPRVGDWILRRTGWKSQHTGELKPIGAPDNLCDTLPGDPGAHGRFDRQARGSTLWTRLRLLLPKG